MTTSSDKEHARVITLCKQKLQGGRGCWQAYELDHDSDGVWLFTPAGSIFRSGDRRSDDLCCWVESGDAPARDSLVLVPDASQKWLATWRVPERPMHISIEVCAWVRRDADVIAFMDWELDPFRLRSGVVAVEDIDDFVEARGAGLLGDEQAELALLAAAWAERAMRRQSPPFDGRADRRLAEFGQLGLPALVDNVPHPFDI